MQKALYIEGNQFLDQYGRQVHLRGVNLSGSTKTPPDEPTHIVNTFANHRTVSFVGRPFPPEDAHEHYARLRHWGFNTLRFLTTWEAIEHAGRGQYDTAYLDYLAEMVELAGDYGFYVFIDPHQDAWSRMTGGDGAPGWTLEGVGFDIKQLDISEAAITMQRRYPDYPTMVWPNNYTRLACATMFTLFFVGDQIEPVLHVDGISVQEYLQGAFIAAMQQVAIRLKDMSHVIGYGPLNEPGKGFIGLPTLDESNGFPQIDVDLSALQAMAVGAGVSIEVPVVRIEDGQRILGQDGTRLLNPHGISVWRETDIWWELGIWAVEDGKPVAVEDDYFAKFDFMDDALLPFTQRYAEAIHKIDPAAIIFMETVPTEASALRPIDVEAGKLVNAGHWYDDFMLFTREFNGQRARNWTLGGEIVSGQAAVQQTFDDAIAGMVRTSEDQMGGIPTLVGEFGLCYDINDKSAYGDGDFSKHELALAMYYDAIDKNLVHSTQWNYTPDNSNQWGDNWNGEDLSIFSRDQQSDPGHIHSGGRAIKGFCRPHTPYVAGRLLARQFDAVSGTFKLEVDVDPAVEQPTLIYLPDIWYRDGYTIQLSSGQSQSTDAPQIIRWVNAESGHQTCIIALAQ